MVGLGRTIAYLHRVQGDNGNAATGIGRAHRKVATGGIDGEWAELAATLL
jgi:hypothetical protein